MAAKDDEETYSCPFCWRDGYTTGSGLKAHFTREHASEIDSENRYPPELYDEIPGSEPDEYVTTECEQCGSEYEVLVSRSEESRFCSQVCHGKSTGEKAGKGDSDARVVVRKRDDLTCQRCGREVSPQSVPDEPNIEIHHIMPRSVGGPDKPANLVTLCEDCHSEVHREYRENEELWKTMRSMIL